MANPAVATQELDNHRRHLLRDAEALDETQHEFEASWHEDNATYCVTPANPSCSRIAWVRRRGGIVSHELAGGRPLYDTPVQNMRAAQAAIAELDNLEGLSREVQEARIRRLVEAANAH